MEAKIDKMEVTREDQNRINAFSKINNKVHDLNAQIKAKKKFLEDLEDAGNELMLSDEESVRCALGDCFIYLDKDAAEERLQATTEESQEDVKKIEAQVTDLKDQLKELKVVLYAKFKDSIQLEE